MIPAQQGRSDPIASDCALRNYYTIKKQETIENTRIHDFLRFPACYANFLVFRFLPDQLFSGSNYDRHSKDHKQYCNDKL